jgi:hypothetical protein
MVPQALVLPFKWPKILMTWLANPLMEVREESTQIFCGDLFSILYNSFTKY